MDLRELNRLAVHTHPSTTTTPWLSNPATLKQTIDDRLATLAPLYDQVSQHGFGNLIGDALEVITYKSLDAVFQKAPRHTYLGYFHLNEPKNEQGRYKKTAPPKHISNKTTLKDPDFIQLGHDIGPLCIECKNRREWLYPHSNHITDLIVRSADLGAFPVLIARRIHYTTISNLLVPAGIIAHETYNQFYPADQVQLASRVREKTLLGFTDVQATEEPDARTLKFFHETLPNLTKAAGAKWQKNKAAALAYARKEINLAQFYTEIDSPAGGKWQDYNEKEE